MGIIANLRKNKEKILCGIRLKKNHVKVGKDVSFRGCPLFHTPNGGLTIENGTTINSGIIYNAIGGNQESSFVTKDNGTIVIGKNVGISNTAFVAQSNITVEDDVLIGGGCCIYDTDFHSVKYEERMGKTNPGTVTKPVRIKKGAFIGAHSIILKGVEIGEYAIVGAGSVVTKSIGGGQIWAGNPARFIRYVNGNKEDTEKNQEYNSPKKTV